MAKKAKKITAVALGLGLAIAGLSSDPAQKVFKCVGKDVQLERGENYYCANTELYQEHKGDLKQRLKDNELVKDQDPGFAQMAMDFDPILLEEVRTELVKLYSPITNRFDFGKDFMAEGQLVAVTADVICNGACQTQGDTMNQRIINLLLQ